MATTLDDQMNVGDTHIIAATITDQNGVAVDMTGGTVKYVLKKPMRSSVKAVSKTTPAGGIVISGAGNNVFTVTLTPVDTKSLTDGDYYHEAKVTLANGIVFTAFSGKMTLVYSGAQ